MCSGCASAVTLEPAPPDAHESGAYAPGRPRGSGAALPLLRGFDRARLRLLRRAGAPRGGLLDIGAGRGRFVATARSAGWQAEGIEPSERGVRGAAEVYGVELLQTGLESAGITAGAGAITLWHVLEHVDDPAAALRRVAGRLAPGGVVLIGVPNRASLQARLGGSRWFHLDLPRHRTHFTPAGIDALLRGAGLEPVRTTHVLAEHNPFGMWQSLVSRVTREPSWLYLVLKRATSPRSPDLIPTLVALPLLPLAALLELVAGLARRGGTIAVAARRPPA